MPYLPFPIYTVQYGEKIEEFQTFEAAKQFAVDELWWVATEQNSEQTFKAWEQASQWQSVGFFPKEVIGGEPPIIYSLARVVAE